MVRPMVRERTALTGLERLLDLVEGVERLTRVPRPSRRGRPTRYGEAVMLKATVILVLRRLPSVYALLGVLDEPEWAGVRARLCDARGRFPTRRTWERRLGQVAARLPVWIARVGRLLVEGLRLWEEDGRAVALDSTALQARGKPWHQRQRRTGLCPDTRIDRDAHWCQAGWHGWVYGYKLHLVVTVAGVWLPLAAELTPANAADNEQAPSLLDALTPQHLFERVFVLGDTAYNDPAIRQHCAQHRRTLVATKRGAYPHPDDGVAVRRLFHQLRSRTIENFNGQFKAIFDCARPVPTKGLIPTQRYVLGAVLVYQLALLHQFQAGGDLRRGLKPLLQAA